MLNRLYRCLGLATKDDRFDDYARLLDQISKTRQGLSTLERVVAGKAVGEDGVKLICEELDTTGFTHESRFDAIRAALCMTCNRNLPLVGFVNDHPYWTKCHCERTGCAQDQLAQLRSMADLVRDLCERVGRLEERQGRYVEALTKIAAYDQGPVVTSSFDSPHDAKIARDALAGHTTG